MLMTLSNSSLVSYCFKEMAFSNIIFLLLSNTANFASKVPVMDIDLNRNTFLNNRGHKGGDFCLLSLDSGLVHGFYC